MDSASSKLSRVFVVQTPYIKVGALSFNLIIHYHVLKLYDEQI